MLQYSHISIFAPLFTICHAIINRYWRSMEKPNYNNTAMLQYSIGTMLNCEVRICRPETSKVYLDLCLHI